MRVKLLVSMALCMFLETTIAQTLNSLNNSLANYYNWSLSSVCSHPGSSGQGGWSRQGSGILYIGRDDTDYYDHCGSNTGPTASINLNVNTSTFFGSHIYIRVTLKAKNYHNGNYGRGEFYVNSVPYFSMYNVANNPSTNSSQVHNSAIGYAGYNPSGSTIPNTGAFPNSSGVSGYRTSNDQYATFVIRIPNPNSNSLNVKWRFMSGKDDLFFGRVEILGESLPPNCTTPSACNVASSAGSEIRTGESSSFSVTGGTPANTSTWSITPTAGVSSTSGSGINTGAISFTNPGTYQVKFTKTNSNSPANCVNPTSTECTQQIVVKSPPDYYPELHPGETQVSGAYGNIDFYVSITEGNGTNSRVTEPVEFRIPNSQMFDFQFDNSLTTINGVTVNNSEWSHTLHEGLHKFTYIGNGGVFTGNTYSRVGIRAVFNCPDNSVGKVPLKITIKSDAGGQQNTANDDDQHKIDYLNY